MQIVIDISDERYKDIKRIASVQMERRTKTCEQIIAKGIPLPKGHGRLIDADVLVDGIEDDYEFCEVVNATPTIIEADKAESETEKDMPKYCDDCVLLGTDGCSMGGSDKGCEACDDFMTEREV